MISSFKNVYASCASIPGNIRESANAVIAALNEMASIADVQNFPEAKKKLMDAMAVLRAAAGDPAITSLNALGNTMAQYIVAVYLNFTDAEHPITADGLAACTGYLPNDSLHQWSYLNPHLYASMMHDFADKGFAIASYVEPRSCCMIAPEDMYVVSVLKRTYGYVSELREDSEMYGWMEAAFTVVLSFADYMKVFTNALFEMQDYYESDMFNDIATAALNDPNMADKINARTAEFINKVGKILTFANRLDGVLVMTNETADILEETAAAINEAYRIYCEQAFKITF